LTGTGLSLWIWLGFLVAFFLAGCAAWGTVNNDRNSPAFYRRRLNIFVGLALACVITITIFSFVNGQWVSGLLTSGIAGLQVFVIHLQRRNRREHDACMRELRRRLEGDP
jgi:hypothetical protein